MSRAYIIYCDNPECEKCIDVSPPTLEIEVSENNPIDLDYRIQEDLPDGWIEAKQNDTVYHFCSWECASHGGEKDILVESMRKFVNKIWMKIRRK